MRNFEGYITTYTEPTDYQPHDPTRCPACQSRREEEGQEGVAELLAGRRLAIVPEGFEQVHRRLTRIRWHAVGLASTEEEEDK